MATGEDVEVQEETAVEGIGDVEDGVGEVAEEGGEGNEILRDDIRSERPRQRN